MFCIILQQKCAYEVNYTLYLYVLHYIVSNEKNKNKLFVVYYIFCKENIHEKY